MKTLMRLLIGILLFALLVAAVSCADDDDDDDDCDCDDDDDDSDDDDDVDDDDDDLFGSGNSTECMDQADADYELCKADCPEDDGGCDAAKCLHTCAEGVFSDLLACAEEYIELSMFIDYFTCHKGCESDFLSCLEPIDSCDLARKNDCLVEKTVCETDCSISSGS